MIEASAVATIRLTLNRVKRPKHHIPRCFRPFPTLIYKTFTISDNTVPIVLSKNIVVARQLISILPTHKLDLGSVAAPGSRHTNTP